MDNLTSFIRLFTLADTTATERLYQRLHLVLTDPTTYEATYAEELLERGIEAGLPRQELRDVALIDGLLAEDLLWEADYKDTASDTADGLNDTLTQQQRPLLDTAALALRASTGPDALDAVQDALEALGLALVLCALDSDSYPLSVVADTEAETTRQLASGLGFTVAVY